MTISEQAHEPPIIAVAAALVKTKGIGYENDLPWKLPPDWLFFQGVTTKAYQNTHLTLDDESDWHNVVIMGRLSWESVPMQGKPLENRFNIVVSRSYKQLPRPFKHAAHTPSLPSAIDMAKKLQKEHGRIFVLGGAQIYNEAIMERHCTHILLTHIHAEDEIACDAYFPTIDPAHYRVASHDELEQLVQQPVPRGIQKHEKLQYQFVLYVRV
ncbi:dihydrofolate reductase-like domain-containing protein [Gongronella butleri]|nr:dihydrofolate reductase-like domain-containing protein [Gongronella butleri]